MLCSNDRVEKINKRLKVRKSTHLNTESALDGRVDI